MLNLLLAAFTTSQLAAFPLQFTNEKNGNEPVKSKEDTTNATEVVFDMAIDTTDEKLRVELKGTFDKYASVSLTNNRGSEIYFKFVETEIQQMTFDLSTLEKGSYFLVLNTNKEIRIKRFVVN